MLKEDISKFVQESSQDNDCIESVLDLLEACQEYVSRVTTIELASIIKRYNMEGNEYRKYIYDLNNSKNKAYNAVVANIKIINRLCQIKDVEVPISCNLEDSKEVEGLAIKLIEELFGH